MSQTKIFKCNCKHGPHSTDDKAVKYQEKIYGAGNRLFVKSGQSYKCSICEKPYFIGK